MSIQTHIYKHLKQHTISKKSIGTGLFEAYQARLSDNKLVFIKYQSTANEQLIHEGYELTLLGKTIHTPKVLGSCRHCLILEWIETAPNPNLQTQIGLELGRLHKNTQAYFGFGFDNKIGQTPQPNAVNQNICNWTEFYWQYRLLHQIEIACQNALLSQKERQQLLKIENILPKLFDDDIQPVLLHGDLWSGNVLSGKNHPYFIDTASYYGHSEMDFALTFMFGGFSQDFYHAYQTINPFKPGFDERKPLYTLYHYLNHLNLFGGSYHSRVMECANRLYSN